LIPPAGEHGGIGLTVHTFSVNPDRITVLYSVDHSTPGLTASPAAIALTDDAGRTYSTLSNAILGSALDVTAGLLTTEPYTGQGKTLSLTLTDMITSRDASATERAGTWSVAFVETLAPGVPVDYSEGTRIAPHDVMSVGDLAMAVAGQPGGRFVKLLVDRQGQQHAFYGKISGNLAEALSEAEFHAQLRAANEASAQFVPPSIRSTSVADDYPPPPDWPTPASRP